VTRDEDELRARIERVAAEMAELQERLIANAG